MRVISVKQPWAYLLCAGIKDIENRTWKFPEKYKGQMVLIHASAKTDKEPYMLFDDAQIEEIGNDIMDVVASYHTVSAIIGSLVFTDCVVNHPSVWAEKSELGEKDENPYDWFKPTYNWLVSEPILFDKPILNVKGRLNFWDYQNIQSVPDDEGILTCNCHLPIGENDQVMSLGDGNYICKYCGGKWYK